MNFWTHTVVPSHISKHKDEGPVLFSKLVDYLLTVSVLKVFNFKNLI